MEDELIMTYPHKVWLGLDLKQAEMYFLCLFSKDSVLKEALYSLDFHKYVAALIEGISIEEVSSDKRELAKTISYNLIYSGFNVEITKGMILKKRRDLNPDLVAEALEKYRETFFCLFNWVKQAVVDWYNNQGYMTYFMRAKKFIGVPAYLPCEPDKLLNSHPGRLCINTYGQNSVGLLLKYTYSKMFNNSIIREHTSQHLQVFDSMNMLVDTEYLGYVIRAIDEYITPVIQYDGFEVQMAVDWKVSVKSWGEMQKIDYSNSNKNRFYYSWAKV